MLFRSERLCDSVIIMKRGRIVDEDSPAALLRRYGRATLEDVFLAVARDEAGLPAPGGVSGAGTDAEMGG